MPPFALGEEAPAELNRSECNFTDSRMQGPRSRLKSNLCLQTANSPTSGDGLEGIADFEQTVVSNLSEILCKLDKLSVKVDAVEMHQIGKRSRSSRATPRLSGRMMEVSDSPSRQVSQFSMFSLNSYDSAEIPMTPKKRVAGPGHESRISTYLGQDCDFQEKTEPSSKIDRKTLAGSGSMHRLTSMIDESTSGQRSQKGRSVYQIMWSFLEDKNSSFAAKTYFHMFPVFIIISVLGAIFDAGLPDADTDAQKEIKKVLQVMQPIFEAIFSLELLARFTCSPNRFVFWLEWFNIIDVASVLNLLTRLVIAHAIAPNSRAVVGLLVLVPVLRLLRLLRRFEQLHLLISAFKASAEALPVLLFTLFLIALTFSAIIFLAEPETVSSLPAALWFSIVTMSTVGYGDTYPTSSEGKLIVAILIIISALYLAIPIGIVGNGFSHVWEERERLMLIQCLRNTMRTAGYTPDDLVLLFQVIDTDNNGELDFTEFSRMIELMQISVSKRWVVEVFETLDDNGAGSINFNEFIRGLFPNYYNVMRGQITEYLSMDRKEGGA